MLYCKEDDVFAGDTNDDASSAGEDPGDNDNGDGDENEENEDNKDPASDDAAASARPQSSKPQTKKDPASDHGAASARPESSKPQTKKELQELRAKYDNTVRLVAHLYHDRSLQDEFRLVAAACRPYMIEYEDTLRQARLSQAWEDMKLRYGLLTD